MSRIALYLGLIESVFAHNSEKVDEARIKEILKSLQGPHPMLKKIEVYRDLTLHSGAVGYADIPDKEMSMAALRSFMEEYYAVLAKLVGKKEAAENIKKPIKEYLTARWNEVVSTKIDWYLPNIALLDIRIENPDLKNMSRGEAGRLFFETILTGYILDLAQTITVSTYQKKLAILKKESVVARAVSLSKEGKATVFLPAEDNKVVVGLCSVFNAFVDLSAFTLGEQGAAEKAQHLIGPVLKFFHPLPTELGATENLIYGRLSPTLPTLMPGFRVAMGGGFPRGRVLLFQVPSGIERNILWTNMVKDALSLKGSVVGVVSTKFPADVKADLERAGLKASRFEPKKKLVFVDWYSHKNERIVGIDVSGTIIKSGKDLTNLEIGLEKGIEILTDHNVGRLIFDSVSAIIKGFDSKSAYSFFQALKKKSMEKNIVIMVFVEKEMHDQKILGWLHQVFDGVIDLSKTDQGLSLRVLSMRGRSIKSIPYPIEMNMNEVVVDAPEEKTLGDKEILAMIDESQKARTPLVSAPKPKPTVREARTKEEHYRLAVELASKREYAEAKKEFYKTLEMDPGYMSAYQGLGAMLLYATGDVEEALTALEKVVELDPSNGDAWFDIGNGRYKKGMIFEAKNAFLEALKVKPYYRWYNSKEFLCPSCNTILSMGTRRCMGCGAELDVTGKMKAPKEKEPAPAHAELQRDLEEGGADLVREVVGRVGEEEEGMEGDGMEGDMEKAPESENYASDNVEESRIFMCPLCGSVVGVEDPQCNSCGAMFQDEAPEGGALKVVPPGDEAGLDEVPAYESPTIDETQEGGIPEDSGESSSADALGLIESELPEHISNEEWDEVLLLADALIAGQRDKPEWILAKGLALTNLQRPKEALLLYKDYITAHPKEKSLLGAISYSLLVMERYPEARKYAETCLKFVPDSPLAMKVLEEVGMREG
ncbi:MAG: ATPase domain-containing protein [Candidatus Thermoplasmatota archaeon]|nr:ATPase domain-containing protein [Candidatus Thermoplasmatota archaeon]